MHTGFDSWSSRSHLEPSRDLRMNDRLVQDGGHHDENWAPDGSNGAAIAAQDSANQDIFNMGGKSYFRLFKPCEFFLPSPAFHHLGSGTRWN